MSVEELGPKENPWTLYIWMVGFVAFLYVVGYLVN